VDDGIQCPVLITDRLPNIRTVRGDLMIALNIRITDIEWVMHRWGVKTAKLLANVIAREA